ncbi:hypothetical protein SRB17_79340 [Streptomyces sp. RB17]|nr:hypothetical protein [Streptomyces sp. RB17]
MVCACRTRRAAHTGATPHDGPVRGGSRVRYAGAAVFSGFASVGMRCSPLRTVDYDKQAADDAAAAGTAADTADGYAKDARNSADTAELDADAARTAASQAEQDAKDTRAAADRADTAATEAEQAAKDADKYAKEAQDAADQAERNKANQQVQTGAATGVGGVFSVIDDIKQDGDPEQLPNECHNFNCNTLVYIAHFDAVVSYYLCLNPDVPATESGCPAEDTVFLKTVTVKGLSKKVKISAWDVTVDLWKGIAKSIAGDFTGCYHKVTGDGDGSLGDCAWAATWLPLGGPLGKIAEAIRGVDAALRSGEGVADALKALKTLDVDAETLADIEHQVEVYEEARTACKLNSFPGTTQVVLAGGSHKALRDVRLGDLLLATDPATGRVQGEPVTRTFHHTAVDLVDVDLTDGGRLTSTPGHRFYVAGHGWTLASDLRPGDPLRSPDGTVRTVAALHDRHQAMPRTGTLVSSADCRDGSEGEHRLDRLARVHVPHRLVDARERIGADQAVQRQPSLLDQLDEGGDEGLGFAVPQSEPDDPLAWQQPVDVQGDFGAEGRGADDDQGAASGERVGALAQHGDVARGLDDSVGSQPAGQRRERVAEVGLGRVDGVGGAQLLGDGEAFGEPVHGDDPRSRGEGGGHHRGQAHGSGAEDHERAARPGFEDFPHGTDPGLHTAAERGDALERHIRVDLHQAAPVHQRAFGEGGLAEEVPAERAAVAADGAGSVGAPAADEVQREPGGAVRGVSVSAVAAVAAGGEGQHDVVAGFDAGHVRAYGLHDTGSFVAEDARQREGQSAARHGEVGVAQAGGDQAHEGLTRSGGVEFDVAKREGRSCGLDHCGVRGGGHTVNSFAPALSRGRRPRT